MTDGDRLLRAILDHPEEDTPRLLYADWLEENGRPERAEFIRVQVAIADVQRLVREQGQRVGPSAAYINGLADRERALLNANFGAWTDGLPESLTMTTCPYCEEQGPDWETGVIECRQCDCTGLVPCEDHVEFRRGFIESVELPLAAFTEDVARALFSAHPVTTVRLSDRDPMPSGDGADGIGGPDWVWVIDPDEDGLLSESDGGYRHFLARAIWDELDGYITTPSARVRARRYPDRDAARAALSAACVAWGRSLVGLPSLAATE